MVSTRFIPCDIGLARTVSVRQETSGYTYSLATMIPTANVYQIHDSTSNLMVGHGEPAVLPQFLILSLIGAVFSAGRMREGAEGHVSVRQGAC